MTDGAIYIDVDALRLEFTEPAGPVYDAMRRLRYEVLRRPLGDPPGSEAFPFEHESLHLAALSGSDVVGCVLFHPHGESGGRLFQMAVCGDLQGRGVGARLVRALEERVRADGRGEITLHARDTAVGFYERLGYACFGDPYVEVGIPHRHMRKAL